jgi:putative addiction module killer protein
LTICILVATLLAMDIRKTEKFSKWLDGLTDIQARARVMVRIERLAMGNPVDVKAVGERAFRNYKSTTGPVTAFTTNCAGASW